MINLHLLHKNDLNIKQKHDIQKLYRKKNYLVSIMHVTSLKNVCCHNLETSYTPCAFSASSCHAGASLQVPPLHNRHRPRLPTWPSLPVNYYGRATWDSSAVDTEGNHSSPWRIRTSAGCIASSHRRWPSIAVRVPVGTSCIQSSHLGWIVAPACSRLLEDSG